MSISINAHSVTGITVRANPLSEFCGTLDITVERHIGEERREELRIVLFGESADAMRSMMREALAADYADKVSDAVIAAFNAYASTLHGRTPEDADPCEACLDALKQDVVSAVTEVLR